uniref:Zinc-ribbon domain-containing protein n=1 Tax=viral metagenome TaxID=1070528 RepID=A0A6M3KGC4_9ZZZZ
MPKGYPDTVTCKECGTGQPSDHNYCPECGAKLPLPKWARKVKIKPPPIS